MRKFETGATRDVDTNKFDYEGFMSPLVLERFAAYMHENRIQADGNLRDADNWQKGIPKDAYMKSMFRHFMDIWKEHRGIKTKDGLEKALCAVLFNAMGYLYEILKDKTEEAEKPSEDVEQPFKVGDIVHIVEKIDTDLFWAEEMEELIGTIGTVLNIDHFDMTAELECADDDRWWFPLGSLRHAN